MIRNINAIIQQFRFQEMIQLLKVDTFFQRFVAGRTKNVIYHFIQHGTLINITFLQDFLQTAWSLRNVLSGRNNHLGHISRTLHDSLQFKRRNLGSVRSRYRKLVMFRQTGSTSIHLLLLQLLGKTSRTFSCRHILFQIFLGFHQFQIACSLYQATVDIFFKLSPSHLDHLFNIAHLQIKQT